MNELNQEAVEKSKAANPKIWELDIRTGDSVEIHMVSQGGVHAKDGDDSSQEIDKVRGVVLGKVNRGLASSLILRDVVFGEVIERKIPMHSPMIKEAKILERNFIFKGKKKVKRAKLYYLRNLNPLRKSSYTCCTSCCFASSSWSLTKPFWLFFSLGNLQSMFHF
jgi:large subunit ribosomal protein L19